MQRQAHAIRQVKGVSLPSQAAFIAADCKRVPVPGSRQMTRVVPRRFRLVTVKLRKRQVASTRVLDSEDVGDLWRALRAFAASGTLTWVVSWNARDLAASLGLWEGFLADQLTLSGDDHMDPERPDDRKAGRWRGYCVLEGPPTVIQFRFKGSTGHLRWIDPANYGIESYHELLRTPRLHMPYGPDAGTVGPDGEPLAEFMVQGIQQWFLSLVEVVGRFDFGSFQTTAASQAQHAFRHRFLDYPLEVHADAAVLQLEREALYSGRCECGVLGYVKDRDIPVRQEGDLDAVPRTLNADGPVYQLDVNSLYPAVARDHDIPSKLESVDIDVAPSRLESWLDDWGCVARVMIETDEPAFPVRIRMKELGRGTVIDRGPDDDPRDYDRGVIWPVGRFWTTLCGPELKLAFHVGNVIRCKVVARYRCYPHFRRWVDELYAWRTLCRQAGDVAGAKVCKRLLNALFGKFAQRAKRWQDEPEALSTEPFSQWWARNAETGLPEQWRAFAWQVQRLVDMGEHPESMPVVTAWITSAARVRLWSMIEAANQYNVYYYDTDSIWTNREGLGKLRTAGFVHQTDLGKLKLERAYEMVQFLGIKHYVADGRMVCAGLPVGSRLNSEGRVDVTLRPPVSSYLWKHSPPGADEFKTSLPVIRPYLHGRMDPDGRTGPLVLRDPDESDFGRWAAESSLHWRRACHNKDGQGCRKAGQHEIRRRHGRSLSTGDVGPVNRREVQEGH